MGRPRRGVELLDTRSRAVFGISEVQRGPRSQALGAARVRAGLGRPWPTAGSSATPRSTQPRRPRHDDRCGRRGALLERVLERARERGFDHVAVTAVREDAPLWSLAERSGFDVDREILRMSRPLDGELPVPRGQTVSRCVPTPMRTGRVCMRCSTRRMPVGSRLRRREHDAWLAVMTEHDEFDPSVWFLVERDGELSPARCTGRCIGVAAG